MASNAQPGGEWDLSDEGREWLRRSGEFIRRFPNIYHFTIREVQQLDEFVRAGRSALEGLSLRHPAAVYLRLVELEGLLFDLTDQQHL